MEPQDGATHAAYSLILGTLMAPPSGPTKSKVRTDKPLTPGQLGLGFLVQKQVGAGAAWLLCPGHVGENTAAFLQQLPGPGLGLTRSLATLSATSDPLKERGQEG